MSVLIIILVAMVVVLFLCLSEMYKQSKLIAYLEDELRDAERELQRLQRGRESYATKHSKSSK